MAAHLFSRAAKFASLSSTSTIVQACALMMHANDALDHAPPSDWNCRTLEGCNGAGASNLVSTPGGSA